MAQAVVMPKLGLTMTEGTIGEWRVKEGDRVKKGDIIFTVETDKLTNEIEADIDGTVLRILVPDGGTAPCKEVLAYIGEEGEEIPEQKEEKEEQKKAENEPAGDEKPVRKESSAGGRVKASPAAKKLAREKGIDISLIAGTGPGGRITTEDVEAYDKEHASGESLASEKRIKTSSVARKIAEEKGVDVSAIEKEGRIMKDDVLMAADAQSNGGFETVRANTLRRSIAKNMLVSWQTSPMVSYTKPVDCTGMKEMRAALKPVYEKEGAKLTYNHIIMFACTKALTEFPDVNSSYNDEMIIRHEHVNIGLAVAKGDGLIVPNVKNTETKTLRQLADETEDLIEQTRTGILSMEDMTGGTFTVTNLGSYGITSFTPIINQPELAILGVCDIKDTPLVENGELVIKPIMNLSLTADHRLIDGVQAAAFLSRVSELIENPYMLL